MPVAATFLFVTERRKPNRFHRFFVFSSCVTRSGFDSTLCPSAILQARESSINQIEELGIPAATHVQSRSKVLSTTSFISQSRVRDGGPLVVPATQSKSPCRFGPVGVVVISQFPDLAKCPAGYSRTLIRHPCFFISL